MRRRLSLKTIQQLVTDYQAGTPSTQLGRQYGISKGAVVRLLREHGIAIRNQPLTPDQVREATKLYRQRLSLIAVGERLGIDQSTVHNALKRAGIPRRDPHGRER